MSPQQQKRITVVIAVVLGISLIASLVLPLIIR